MKILKILIKINFKSIISVMQLAFFPSPFDEAIVLTLDGVGEWATTSVAVGKNNTRNVKRDIFLL